MRSLVKKRFAVVLLLLTGCAGLIGVPDLTLQEEGEEGGLPDGSSSGTDGQTGLDANTTDTSTPKTDSGTDAQPPGDGGTDSATCDLSKTSGDPLNCGSCGHICLDDAGCSQGQCGATILTTLPGNLGITELIENGNYLYGATDNYADSDAQGVYRIDKTTGVTSQYVKLRHAWQMAVVGDYLWITTYSSTYDVDDPSFSNGGIFRCKLVPADTCALELVAPVDYPSGLNAIGTSLYYSDYGRTEFRKLDTTGSFIADGGSDAEAAIKKYGGTSEINNLYEMFVDPGATPDTPATYFLDEYTQTVVAYKLNPGGTSAAAIGQYENSVVPADGALHGKMVGTSTSVYWSASDYAPEVGGSLKRVTRSDNTSCDLGNRAAGKNQVLRPQNLFLDAKNVYWTNRGEWGPAFQNGSIAMCPVDTCCPEAQFVWNGSGQPWAVVGDQAHLYWSLYNTGDIYKTTKP
jgi:hypothetical protein